MASGVAARDAWSTLAGGQPGQQQIVRPRFPDTYCPLEPARPRCAPVVRHRASRPGQPCTSGQTTACVVRERPPAFGSMLRLLQPVLRTEAISSRRLMPGDAACSPLVRTARRSVEGNCIRCRGCPASAWGQEPTPDPRRHARLTFPTASGSRPHSSGGLHAQLGQPLLLCGGQLRPDGRLGLSCQPQFDVVAVPQYTGGNVGQDAVGVDEAVPGWPGLGELRRAHGQGLRKFPESPNWREDAAGWSG